MEEEVFNTYNNLFHFTGHNKDLFFLRKWKGAVISLFIICCMLRVIIFNPFTPENFAQYCVLKLIKLFSGHCLATISQNAVCELSTSQSPQVLFQMESISFQHLIMLRKHNFKLVFRFKSDTAVLKFIFHSLSSRHWWEMFWESL